MAKKKPQYPNKVRNTVLTGVISFALIALLTVLVALNVSGRNYIMRFEGEKISAKDYKMYLYQQKFLYESFYGTDMWTYDIGDNMTLADSVSHDALNMLLQQRIGVKMANEKGLTLTAEQEQQAIDSVDSIRESFSSNVLREIGMSDKELLEFMKNDMMLSVLFDHVTADFVVDEDEFEEFYQQYLIDNNKSLTTVNIDYIVTDDEARAEEARERMQNGDNIFELIKEYSIDYVAPEGEEEDPRATPSSASANYNLPTQVVDIAYEMSEGEISEIIRVDVTDYSAVDEDSEEQIETVYEYYIVRVDSIELPDYDTVREDAREQFTAEKKNEIFDPLFEEWFNSVEFEINEAMYSRIYIGNLPQ